MGTRRRRQLNDALHASTLAQELDGLALAMEHAAAYIAQRRLSLFDYLTQWRIRRDKLLAWHDERLTGYPKSVAVTWLTSFEQLGKPARGLFQRVSWDHTNPRIAARRSCAGCRDGRR